MKLRKWIPLLLILAMLAPMAYPLKTEAVSLNKTKTTIVIGQARWLKVTGTSKKVKWSSSDKAIATVTSTGKVKAKKAGKCTIKAKVGGRTYSCTVTVIGSKKVAKMVAAFIKKYYPSSGLVETERKGRYSNVLVCRPQGDGAPGIYVKVDLLTGYAYFNGKEDFFERLPAKKKLWK